MHLLLLFDVGVELCDALQSELFHEIDLIGLDKVLVLSEKIDVVIRRTSNGIKVDSHADAYLELLDSQWKRGREKKNLAFG